MHRSDSNWSVRAFLSTLLVASAVACSKEKPKPPPGTPPPAGSDDQVAQGQQDAEFLGKELLDVLDRVMSYRSSHRGQLPKSLRQTGIDSLTGATVRRLSRQNDLPLVAVQFRATAGRAVVSCQGTSDLREEASLNSGEITVMCTVPGGGTGAFKVGKLPEPKKKKD